MSKTAKRFLWFALACVVVGAIALPKILSSQQQSGPKGGPGAGGGRGGGRNDTLRVDAYVVTPERLVARIVTTGAIQANESVDLASEASGKLIRILFEEGRSVGKGQLIVKINDAELQAQRARTVHRLTLAQKREERQRLILKQGGISQEEYDMAQSELNVLKSEIDVIDAQIAKTEIRAPFSGIIGLRYVSEGTFVSPQTRIATLHNLDPIKIDFSIPEKYSSAIRVGTNIRFRVEGSDQLYQARVYAVEPLISQNTRTMQLRAVTRNPGHRLMPGAFANVELIQQEIDGALAVPAMSIVPELDTKRVYVYKAGKAEPRDVETGIRTDEVVQVVNGLAAGDTVLTSGVQQLRPGAPVKINNLGAGSDEKPPVAEISKAGKPAA